MVAKTILVVDDEIYVLDSIQRMLSALKYTILTASSGSAALDILTGNAVDLILLDIRMPDIDGKRVCTKVREVEPDIPIIIISGMDIPDVKAFAKKEGAFAFLEKPVELDKLRPLIEAAIGKPGKQPKQP
jgi:CheY-like chemotaxis protein